MDLRVPSEITDRYWLVADDPSFVFDEKRNENSGKWLIFDRPEVIDAYWIKIKEGLLNGLLGPSAKVSTSKFNKNAADNSSRVICVFTKNFMDKVDLKRIVKAIRFLGINNKLIYKLDSDVGRYKHKGDEIILNCYVLENDYRVLVTNTVLNDL